MAATISITSEKFLEAWCSTWNEVKHEDATKKFERDFQEKSVEPQTQYMLKDDNAFLKRVANNLGFKNWCENQNEKKIYQVEYNLIDIVFISNYNKGYPYLLDVVIEHENQPATIINEMWKLQFIRAPLKVIILYGHPHNIETYIAQCINLLGKANEAFHENENTEYLFIVGALNDAYQMSWSIEKYKFDKTPSRQKLKPR